MFYKELKYSKVLCDELVRLNNDKNFYTFFFNIFFFNQNLV